MSSILSGISFNHEGQLLTETKTYKLWESAGQKLVEAQLTADQITQLFANIEQSSNAAGNNRTGLGKTVDATSAVNNAWKDLKAKISNSGPVKGFDQKVSDALSKIGMGASDPEFNGQVTDWVQKYRDFANKYPMAQQAILGTLIAIAGITGAGVGGAAAIGLLRTADQLIQGKRFSSAAYSGAKAGAAAYAAGKIGDFAKDKLGGAADAADAAQTARDTTQATRQVAKGSPQLQRALARMDKARQRNYARVDATNESLNEATVALLFTKIDEGLWDTIKGKTAQVGKNLTTKVTADKLMSAWKKAGSPTDSNEIWPMLVGAGVPEELIQKVYKQLKIRTSTPKTKKEMPASDTSQPSANNEPAPSNEPIKVGDELIKPNDPRYQKIMKGRPSNIDSVIDNVKSISNSLTKAQKRQLLQLLDNSALTESNGDIHVPGYGNIPLDMLKRHVQSLSKDFNDNIQKGEFLKAAYRTEQFYNALMALAKALKQQENIKETNSTGLGGGTAGIGGGSGLGIDKSPMEKVLEKPLGEGEVVSMQARKTPLVIAGEPYDWDIYDLRTNKMVANILGGDRHDKPLYEIRINSNGMTPSTRMLPTYVLKAGPNNNPPYKAYELEAPSKDEKIRSGVDKIEKSPGPGGTTKLKPDTMDVFSHMAKQTAKGLYYGMKLILVEEGLDQYELIEKALGAKIMEIDDAMELGYTDWNEDDGSGYPIIYLGNQKNNESVLKEYDTKTIDSVVERLPKGLTVNNFTHPAFKEFLYQKYYAKVKADWDKLYPFFAQEYKQKHGIKEYKQDPHRIVSGDSDFFDNMLRVIPKGLSSGELYTQAFKEFLYNKFANKEWADFKKNRFTYWDAYQKIGGDKKEKKFFGLFDEEEQIDELKCWPGYTRVRGVPAGAPGSCKKKTKESSIMKGIQSEEQVDENKK